MAASSVTGLGPGSGSCHSGISVNHLIGPRWTEDKEKEFAKLKSSNFWLWVALLASNLALSLMATAYYIMTTR